MDGGGVEVTAVDELRTNALRAFHAWSASRVARPELLKPQPAEVSYRRVARLLSAIARRSLRRCSRPAIPRASVTAPRAYRAEPPDDLWRLSPEDVKAQSLHTAICPTCDGSAKAACVTCAGAHRVGCDRCGSRGRVISTKTGNAINCRSCRGSGQRACGHCSTRGLATCSECDGEKKVEVWFELEETRRFDVQVEPDGVDAGGFRWANDGVDATLEEVQKDAFVLGSVSGPAVSLGMCPAEHRAWLGETFPQLAPRVGEGERVIAQSLDVLEVPRSKVAYSVGDRTGSVVFLGRRMLVQTVDEEPIIRYRRRMSWVRRGVAATMVTLATAYFARGAYFLNAASAVMASCAVLAALCFIHAIGRMLFRRPARTFAVAAAVLALCASVAGYVAGPTRARAAALLTDGHLDAASVEIAALGAPRDLVDRLTNARILTAVSSDKADALARSLGSPYALTARARDHVFRLRVAEVQGAVERRDLERADMLFARFEGSEQLAHPDVRRLRHLLLAASAQRCIEVDDRGCTDRGVAALEREGFAIEAAKVRDAQVSALRRRAEAADGEAGADTRASMRVPRLERAIELWKAWAHYTKAAIPRGSERAALLERARVERVREEAAERARVAAAEREAARQAKLDEQRRAREAYASQQRELAAARAEQRRERARNYAPLLCNDGSLSPSCTCGRDSYRGCCSHHGGVSGCSVDD